jgi:DNA-binding MarR family transcriptional regulator
MTRSTPPVDFYQSGSYRPEESVGYLMKKVLLSIVQQADKRLANMDLTMTQLGPLMRLGQMGPLPVAELARWVNTDAGAMTRLLDRLEKKRLCKRIRSLEDRRVVMVELTAEGRQAIEGVPAVLSEVMNLHLAGFDKAEWQLLKGSLLRMIDNGDALRHAGV